MTTRLHGRLSCIWAIYTDKGLDLSAQAGSTSNDLRLVGEADYGEVFVEKLLLQAKDFAGGLYVFRKHISPTWDSLSTGGHFRVEQSLLQQNEDEQKNSMVDKFDFICDVVDEKLARTSMIAGVGLCRTSMQSMVLSLWLIGTESTVVESLRSEVFSRVGSTGKKATIRFIHHNSINESTISRPGALSVMPMLLHLAFPSININDLPAADDASGLTPPGASWRRGEEASPPLGDQSFQHDTLNTSLNRHSSSLSVFEHHKASFESGGLPAPTPVTDWASSWTPSMFFAAHQKSSTSTDTTATSGREKSPNGTPPPQYVVPLVQAHPSLPTATHGVVFQGQSLSPPQVALPHSHLPQPQIPESVVMSYLPVEANVSLPQPQQFAVQPLHYSHFSNPPPVIGFGAQQQVQFFPQTQNFNTSQGPQSYFRNSAPAPPPFHQNFSYSPFVSAPPQYSTSVKPASSPPPADLSKLQPGDPLHPPHRGCRGAPQSERKAFVFRGKVFPPFLNRKEYRLIVHHCDDTIPPPLGQGVDRIDAFPAPHGVVDGDIELEVYEQWYLAQKKK
ncbi:Hypothetical protein, putative [Bodo saltans]|uniref:Uncharacterized protein n=1 Tax=Bodo saltans TaxID=75058 RepID=A0A0S4J1B5_BODSA|nr:Hypothetical protein, putative [Bodo saltans]|eukprot:CUG55171.1 Hypothetical protein, putative [Bodo saltans]